MHAKEVVWCNHDTVDALLTRAADMVCGILLDQDASDM
jgi:hypothetical protein